MFTAHNIERIGFMVMKTEDLLHSPLRVIALQDKDLASLALSASGGAFPVLARPIVQCGGIVFGAEMLPGGAVRHVGVRSMDELERLQGSKYVQSDYGKTFFECAEALKTGKTVLWTGTGCQIFALRSYLIRQGLSEGDMSRLYTADVICHGVIGQSLFRQYISWLEKKNNAVPGSLHYEFRSKRRGWGLYYRYTYKSIRSGRMKEKFGAGDEDPYYAAFLSGKLYRSSCYKCRFARRERASDFTLGDYWGIQEEHPGFDCAAGASVLMINTPKGKTYFETSCESACKVQESTFEKASRHNFNLIRSTQRNEANAEFAKKVEDASKRGDVDFLFRGLLAVRSTPGALLLRVKRRAGWLLPMRAISRARLLLRRLLRPGQIPPSRS